jgi:ring-1,2-phenylacetyl-CoA epoxidase subunit PaaD
MISKEKIKTILSTVVDPEIPSLNIEEMGILREILIENNLVKVVITPTYSGCPAMYHIESEVRKALNDAGIQNFQIETRLNPAWTTDWMTTETKQKLKESGIAPPQSNTNQLETSGLFNIIKVPINIFCPFCNSDNTKIVSEFGSTACKSLHFCNNCHQPFDHFKCH